MNRYALDMGENEAITIITESRNLRALPFRPSEDQLSNGKAWEDWLDGIEREFRYFKITNALDKKDAMIIYGGQELARLEKSLPDPDGDLDVYQKLRKKLNDYYIPKRNKHYARYMFLKMRPTIGESTVAYATRLREKAYECDFGSNCDDRILEHLIQTIHNELLIQKCISKAWTLKEFLSEAGQIEDIADQVHVMKDQPRDRQYIARIDTHNTIRKKMNRKTLHTGGREEHIPICRYCGYPEIHLAIQDCPAYGKRCHKCQKRNHFAEVCKAYIYREPVLERTKGRYQGRDTDKIKKATKKSDSCESSDDEFITQSVAHMKIKKVQNISHSNGMGGGLIQGKQKASRWRQQDGIERNKQGEMVKNLRQKHEKEVIQLRLELERQTKAIETKFEQTIKMLIDEMNFMISTRNYNAEVGEQKIIWTQTACMEKNSTNKKKTESNNDNRKEQYDLPYKQQIDKFNRPQTRELQGYDWWENTMPRTMGQIKGEENKRIASKRSQRYIDRKEMGMERRNTLPSPEKKTDRHMLI